MSIVHATSKRRAVLAMLAGTTLMVLSPIAHGSVTWDGGGSDNNWGTDANWNPNSPFNPGSPVPDGDLIFSDASTNTANVDGTYTQLNTIRFKSGTDSFTINSGSLVFNGSGTGGADSIANNSSNTMTVNSGLVIGNGGLTVSANSGDINLGGTIFTGQGNIVFEAQGVNRTITASGAISGGSAIVLDANNTGTVALTADNSSHSGGIILNGGTLTLGNDNALGSSDLLGVFANAAIQSDNDARSISNQVAIDSGQTLTVRGTNDLELAGPITGQGGLTMNGTGTLTLNGTNTYTGVTNITQGTLQLGASDLDKTSSVIINGGTLDTGSSGSNKTVSNLTLRNDGSITGTEKLQSSNNFNLQSGTVGVELTGSGGLTKTTSGTVALNAPNTYTGGTTINDGTLILGDNGALGTGGLTVNGGSLQSNNDSRNFANNTTLSSGSNLTLSGTNNLTVNGTFSGNGAITKSGSNTVTLNGANNFAGGVTVNNGALTLGNDNALGTGTLNVTAPGTIQSSADNRSVGNNVTLGNTLTVAGGKDMRLTGDISGTGGLTKTGTSGGLVLEGNNTFSGDLNISDGSVSLVNGNAMGDNTKVNLANTAFATLRVRSDETIGGLTGGGSSGGGVVLEDPSGVGKTLTVNNTANNTFSGVLSGNGALTKTGSGTLTLAGANTFNGDTTVTAGELALPGSVKGDATINGGSLSGAGSVMGNLATAGGDVNLSGNSSFDTMNVGGNFTLASGDTLFIDIGSSNQSDKVAVGNSATLQSGSTVKLVQSGTTTAGETFTIVTTGSGVTDGSSLDTTGLSGTFSKAVSGNDLTIDLTSGGGGGGGTPPPPGSGGPFESAAAGSENPLVGRALDNASDPALLAAVGPAAASTTTRFANQVNDGARATAIASNVTVNVNQAFSSAQTQYLAATRSGSPALAMAGKSMLGSVTPARPMLASAAADPRLLGSVLAAEDAKFSDENARGGETGYRAARANHVSMSESGDINANAPSRPPYGAFVKGFGLFSNIDGTSERTGYRADTYGMAGGLDYQINDHLLAGVAFGYARTRANLDNGLGDLTDDTYRLGPYVSWNAGHFFVDGSASYGYHDQSSDRNTAATGESSANFHAQDVTAYLGGGYDFTFGNGWVVTPTVSAQYTYYDRDGYSESGVGGLKYDELRNNTLTSRVGAQVSYRIENSNFAIVPEVAAGWEHEYLQDEENINARFASGSSTFAVSTASPEEDTVYAAAGVSFLFGKNTSAFLQYEGNYGEQTIIHGVAGGLTFRF